MTKTFGRGDALDRDPEIFRLATPLRRYCGITVVGSDVTLSNTEP